MITTSCKYQWRWTSLHNVISAHLFCICVYNWFCVVRVLLLDVYFYLCLFLFSLNIHFITEYPKEKHNFNCRMGFLMKCQCFETENISFVAVFERICRTTRSTSHGLQFKPPGLASFYSILLRPVSHCLANKHLDWIWTYQFWNLKGNTPYKNIQRGVYKWLICVLTSEGKYNFTQSLHNLKHPLHSFFKWINWSVTKHNYPITHCQLLLGVAINTQFVEAAHRVNRLDFIVVVKYKWNACVLKSLVVYHIPSYLVDIQ